MPVRSSTTWMSRRDLLRTVSAGVITVATAAACSPARRDSTPDPSLPATGLPDVILDVSDFGAVGDGRTDDTDAVVRALAAAKSGQAVRLTSGKVFAHDSVIHITTAGVQLVGPGELRATSEETSAVQVLADGVVVSGLTLSVEKTTKRWSAPDQHKLFVGPHSDVVVRDVSITGSAAAGLFCQGTSQFQLAGIRVTDSRADGIHMTDGANTGTVTAPVITNSGDDGVAVVSYTSDSARCHDISIHSPIVHGTSGGRGLSVVGVTNVNYSGITVADSSAASVYIACENGDFVTYPTDHVTVSGGTITGANTDSSIDHGAVLVYSARPDGGVSDVTVSDLQISATRSSASRQIGVVVDDSSPVSAVSFADLRLAASPPPYEGNAPLSGLQLHDVQAAGAAVSATVTR